MIVIIDVILAIVSVLVLLLIYTIYIGNRNNDVLRFRLSVIDLVHKKSSRLINEDAVNGTSKPWNIYKKMPTYEQMLRSWKSLKLENFLSKEDIEYLNS